MIYKKIGQKIRILRENAKISQKRLAEEIGYKSDTAIYLIENGKRKLSIECLIKIAKFFRVSVEDIVTDRKYPNPSISVAVPINWDLSKDLYGQTEETKHRLEKWLNEKSIA